MKSNKNEIKQTTLNSSVNWPRKFKILHLSCNFLPYLINVLQKCSYLWKYCHNSKIVRDEFRMLFKVKFSKTSRGRIIRGLHISRFSLAFRMQSPNRQFLLMATCVCLCFVCICVLCVFVFCVCLCFVRVCVCVWI